MITVSHISRRYGQRLAVDDMTFSVAAGRVTGFVGPNGAGKSTAMRIMVGLTRPDQGEVRFDGVRYADLRQPARVVGPVLDARCLHPGRTARQHLAALAAASGLPASRADAVLAEVGLERVASQRTGGFSLGMRQRLALAGALIGEPRVLLLDEPSNGLDPEGIRWLRTWLTGFARSGGTVFVSTHLISELEMFADDLVVVGGGKVIAAAPVGELVSRSQPVVIAETPHPAELLALLTGRSLDAELVAGRVHVRQATCDAIAQIAFDHRLPIVGLTAAGQSLEETLLDLTRPASEFTAA